MKAILFNDKNSAETLISQINEYVGSTAITDPIESDEGWLVLVPVVSTSSEQINLPSMVKDKQLVIPTKVVIEPSEQPTVFGGTL